MLDFRVILVSFYFELLFHAGGNERGYKKALFFLHVREGRSNFSSWRRMEAFDLEGEIQPRCYCNCLILPKHLDVSASDFRFLAFFIFQFSEAKSTQK